MLAQELHLQWSAEHLTLAQSGHPHLNSGRILPEIQMQVTSTYMVDVPVFVVVLEINV